MIRNKKLLNVVDHSQTLFFKWSHKWSAIATAFNRIPTSQANFNFLKEAKGLFDVPELINSQGFHALKERCLVRTDHLITEAISSNRDRKMVEIFDELSDTLCKVADLAEFIRIAHPNTIYSKLAENTCVSVSGIVEKLNTNYKLYKTLKSVIDNGDKMETNSVDKHTANLFLFDFEQSGIHLADADRTRVVQLNDAILHLGQHFVNNCSNYRTVKRKYVPPRIRNLFTSQGSNIIISGLHSDSSNPLMREVAYKIYLHPENHQECLLRQMLKCRYLLAEKCGFTKYSDRALKGSLVETPEVANKYLKMLSNELRPRADADLAYMCSMKKKENVSKTSFLASWDVSYYSHKLKRDRFHVTSNEYSSYFSLGACMDGLNKLIQALYGVTLVNTDVAMGEIWAQQVFKLSVVHETEGLLGYIYCDFFERHGKPNQDCHFTIQGGKLLPDGSYQIPIVVLMLNLNMPYWSNPSLLTPGMVDNLFHEMGHAMHSMLARTCYQHVTGTRCSTDFAEVPSILMEYFSGDPRVIATFARHYQTGEPMSTEMINRLCASKHAFAASEMQLQVFYSALDQVYHSELAGRNEFDCTTNVLEEIQTQYYSLPHVQGTAWQLRFSHLVGYGAKYYSYLISKAVASWIWKVYFENDPFNRENGKKYRNECLNYGGGKPPHKLLTDYLQTEVTPTNLVETLIREIDEKSPKFMP